MRKKLTNDLGGHVGDSLLQSLVRRLGVGMVDTKLLRVLRRGSLKRGKSLHGLVPLFDGVGELGLVLLLHELEATRMLPADLLQLCLNGVGVDPALSGSRHSLCTREKHIRSRSTKGVKQEV